MSNSNPILLKARSELVLLPHNLAQPRFMWVETQSDPAGHFQLMWVKTAFTLQLSFPSPCTQMYKNNQMPLSPRFPWDKAPCTTCHLLFLQHSSCRRVAYGRVLLLKGQRTALWAGWDFHVLSVLFSCLPILCSRYCLEVSTVIWVKSSITYFYGFLHTPHWNGGQAEVPPLPEDLSHFSSWCLTWLPDSCHQDRQLHARHSVQKDPPHTLHAPFLKPGPKFGKSTAVGYQRPQKRSSHCKCLWFLESTAEWEMLKWSWEVTKVQGRPNEPQQHHVIGTWKFVPNLKFDNRFNLEYNKIYSTWKISTSLTAGAFARHLGWISRHLPSQQTPSTHNSTREGCR